MKIDSHQHFWKYNIRDHSWISPEMKVIKRDFLPADLQNELKKNGFDGSVAVQARQTTEETEWLLHLADHFSFIKGVVGWVDLRSNKLEKQLEAFSMHPRFVGVRHVIQDEPDDNFILSEVFQNGIRVLEKYDLVYDILIFQKHLPQTIEFVKKFPGLTFVLDHIAKPLIKEKVMSPWKEKLTELAKFPNVYCKISGMVTEADWFQWQKGDFVPYLDIVFNTFGTDRVMIGSDWPVCLLAGKYSEIIEIVSSYIANFSEHEKKAVFGENAVKAYRLKI
jgi:L-fuconolactonase